MAADKAGLIEALASFFKSQDYTSENDPEPGVSGSLPASTGDDAAHRTACSVKWKDALQTYIAAMDPPHVPASAGAATTALAASLLAAFNSWATSDSPQDSCSDLDAAFADMADVIATAALPPTDQPTWTWVADVAPPAAVGLCSVATIDENSSTPFTSAATNFADKIDTWFKTGISNYVDPGMNPHSVTWE
jgi:hypothetical protein